MRETLYEDFPDCGVVIGTYASVPYVHLQLALIRETYPDLPVLVHDDCSERGEELKTLCLQYKADFRSTTKREGHPVGDAFALAAGLEWASERGVELLVKFSRRWIYLCEWLSSIQFLAVESQASTFSSWCKRWGFGFRTECLAAHVSGWVESGAVAKLRGIPGGLLEQHVDRISGEVETCQKFVEWMTKQPAYPDRHKNYAQWPLMRASKGEKVPWLLWHETNGKDDYAAELTKLGVEYDLLDWQDSSGTGLQTVGETRNLLYHIYPVAANGVWQWNVAQLLRRIGLFNGKRIVAIAVDERTDSAETVKRAFNGAVEDFVVLKNRPDRREVESHQELFSRVRSEDPNEVTFYAHAKGVTSTSWAQEAVRLWAGVSYELCLDYFPAVKKLFKDHPVVGPFKRTIRAWAQSASAWHYSGTFYWFRNAALYTKDWRTMDEDFFGGSESYPSLHFSEKEAGCLFYEFKEYGKDGLYQADCWHDEIFPKLEVWKKDNRGDYAPPQLEVAEFESNPKITDFHNFYYDRGWNRTGTWTSTFWRGVPVEKCPLDLWIYQEILHEIRPEVIVEAGTAHGGSALFLANMCDLEGHGKVISIDTNPREPLPQHPRITWVRGSSVSRSVLARVREEVEGKKTLVILDSDHKQKHVLAEMDAYAPLVSIGSYLIVEDTNINGHPALPTFGPGPWEAVELFLFNNDGFVPDRSREKLLLTFNPKGYLKRVR